MYAEKYLFYDENRINIISKIVQRVVTETMFGLWRIEKNESRSFKK